MLSGVTPVLLLAGPVVFYPGSLFSWEHEGSSKRYKYTMRVDRGICQNERRFAVCNGVSPSKIWTELEDSEPLILGGSPWRLSYPLRIPARLIVLHWRHFGVHPNVPENA
jgi:hypothetical protein